MITIKLCTAATIQSQLIGLDDNGGMRGYWFDELVLTDIQIQHCLDEATAFAGPRYTAALDVVTSAHIGLDFFGGIGDFRTWREESLMPIINELQSLKSWGDSALNIVGEHDATTIRQLIGQIIVACENMTNVSLAAAEVVEASKPLSTLLPLLNKTREAHERAFYSKHGIESDTPGFRQFHAEYMCTFPAGEMDAARKLEEQALRIQAVFASPELVAATTRSLLLIGPAVIGKTHAIVSAAHRRLARGGRSLVIFCDDFGKAEPWEVIRSKLGFGAAMGRSTLLEILQACAKHTVMPFIIYIDALNESPLSARWKDKLPELLEQCKPYDEIKVCVSTRDTYRDLVVDSRFPGYAFEYIGFWATNLKRCRHSPLIMGLMLRLLPCFHRKLITHYFYIWHVKHLKLKGENLSTYLYQDLLFS